MLTMPRLWWLPYTVFALIGAPFISVALAPLAALASSELGAVYLVVVLGVPVGLVIGVMVERRSRASAVAVLAVASLAMCLAAQVSMWSGIG